MVKFITQMTRTEYAAGDVFRRWFKYQATPFAVKKDGSRPFLKGGDIK